MKNKKTLVLERRHVVGGAAISEELWPGYTISRASYLLSLFRSKVVEEIFPSTWEDEIKLFERSPSSFSPTKERGKYLLMGGGAKFDHNEISKFSQSDALAYPQYEADIGEIVDIITPMIDAGPPERMRDYLRHALHAYRTKKRLSVPQLYQVFTSPAATILDNYFESPLLKATLATDAVIGELSSPYTQNSAYVLLHHVMGEIRE